MGSGSMGMGSIGRGSKEMGVRWEREHGDGVEDMEKVYMGIGVGDMGLGVVRWRAGAWG